MIVLDTSVLSLVLRRRKPDQTHAAVKALQKLLQEQTLLLVPGIVFQEVLSGIRDEDQFESLLERMRNFSVLVATLDDHVLAAQIANDCSAKGVTIAVADALIAAQVAARDGLLFTTDRDFALISHCTPLKLFDFGAFLSA